ncbi:MAG: hypothetical protein KGK30_00905, partial [Elusimicrobia bacterium]|nr:hypothetical protein [Elusimicrobiota bacterium]
MKHARSLFSALLVAALPLASLAGGPIKVELGAGSAGVALSGYGFSPLMVQRSYWFAPLAAYQQWHAQNPSLPDALAGLDLNRPGDQALAAPLLRAFSRQDLSLQYDLPGIAKLDVAKAQALNGVLVEAVRQAARRSRSKIEQVAGQLLRQARQREGDADALAAAQAFLRKAAALYGEQAGSDSISQAEQQVGSMVESLRGKKVEQTVDAGAAALQTAAALPTHNSVSLAD